MKLRPALMLFLALLVPVARADEPSEKLKRAVAAGLLKALLVDDDADKPKRA